MKWTRILMLAILFLALLVPGRGWAGEDVTFTWDPYTETEPVEGFKLYMSATPNVVVTPINLVATILGKTTTAYKQLSVPAGPHYWVLTAFMGTLESGPSNEVTYVVRLKPPSGLGSKVVLSFGNVTVTVAAK